MGLADQVVAWLGQLVFLVLGAVLGFVGSWLTARYSWTVQKASEDKRNAQEQERIWKQCLIDLLGEVDDNLHYQSLEMWIPLENEAYKRLRQQGLTMNLDENLQIELRRVYGHIHQKNSRLHYNDLFMTSIPLEQRTRLGSPIAEKIGELHRQIDNELFQLKPKLMELVSKIPS